MIEEQHVTGYGSLIDPSCTMLERWVMHEYIECYLYYSCYMDETDDYIKKIWLEHYEQELTHLKIASEMLYKYEGRNYEQLFVTGSDFPTLIKLQSNIDYVRDIMKSVRLTAVKESMLDIEKVPNTADFFKYQKTVNGSEKTVASHLVIDKYIKKHGEDYRFEKAPSVEKTLRDRKTDNTTLGRVKGK
jgi:rubrerythrin